jgi:hypothetical protein
MQVSDPKSGTWFVTVSTAAAGTTEYTIAASIVHHAQTGAEGAEGAVAADVPTSPIYGTIQSTGVGLDGGEDGEWELIDCTAAATTTPVLASNISSSKTATVLVPNTPPAAPPASANTVDEVGGGVEVEAAAHITQGSDLFALDRDRLSECPWLVCLLHAINR